MIITLYTEEFFNAAHLLENYNGKCSEIHGHTWKVSLWIKGEENQKDQVGLLWDFNNLKKIVYQFDHKNLNNVLPVNPSVENITKYIYDHLKKEYQDLSFKVRVYENTIKKESYCEIGDF